MKYLLSDVRPDLPTRWLRFIFRCRLCVPAGAAPCSSGHPEQHPDVRRAGLHTQHAVSSARPRPHRQAAKRGPWMHAKRTRQGQPHILIRPPVTQVYCKWSNLISSRVAVFPHVASWLREFSNGIPHRDRLKSDSMRLGPGGQWTQSVRAAVKQVQPRRR